MHSNVPHIMALAITLGMSAVAVAEEDEIIEEIVVIGTRASLMNAVDKQEASDSFISVVDSDALGDFPDTTAAEAIRRLSGISIENDQGEGRYVTIRGMSSDLNAVAINGTSVMSPETDRSVLLDGVPTELLDSITVHKTNTPDLDADSIGGRIDFATKNPSDITERLFKVKLDTQYNEQAKSKDNLRVSMTYGNPLSETSGHILGVTYSTKDIITYNNETGYGWEQNDNGSFYMNDDYEMRYYDLTRERYGVTYDFDRLIGDSNRFFVSLFWNEYIDDELRWKDEYGYLDKQSTLDINSMDVTRIKHDAETRQREESRTIQAYTVGFDHRIGEWDSTVSISYSYAEQDDTDNADATFRYKEKDDDTISGTISWADPQKPIYTARNLDMYDVSKLKFDEIEFEDSISEDRETAFRYDLEKEYDFGTVKFGTKYRSRTKDVDNNKQFYEMDATMADFNPQQMSTWTFAGQTFGPMADPALIFALQNNRSGLEFAGEETFEEDFTTREDIFALYGMTTLVGDNSRTVVGIRWERTDWESDAYVYDPDRQSLNVSRDHNFFAPSLNVRYTLTDNWIMRAAYSRSMTRPGFSASAPVVAIERNGEERSGRGGNPNLKPLESDNFDLSLEYYTNELTFLSAGIFYKDIENAIYRTIRKNFVSPNGVDINDGYETWINADESTILGLEFNFQYGLDNGLFAAINLTKIPKAESTFSPEDGTQFTTPFRKMADFNSNISLGFDKGPWDIRLSVSHRNEYLDWLADEEDDIDTVSINNSRFVDDHTQWDFVAKYKFTDQITGKFEAINMGDEPEFYYWGSDSRLSQYDEYGSSYSLGFTYQY